MINIAFIIAFLGITLLRIYYSVSKKIKEIKSYEFDLHFYENKSDSYYTISYQNENEHWIEGKELLSNYIQILNDYQKELLMFQTLEKKEGNNYLQEFKRSIYDLSYKNVMFSFKLLSR